MIAKYVDNPFQRKCRVGLSVFLWTIVGVIIYARFILDKIKSLDLPPAVSIVLFFLVMCGPTVVYSIWAIGNRSENLWLRSKDWSRPVLLISIIGDFGLIVLKARHLV